MMHIKASKIMLVLACRLWDKNGYQSKQTCKSNFTDPNQKKKKGTTWWRGGQGCVGSAQAYHQFFEVDEKLFHALIKSVQWKWWTITHNYIQTILGDCHTHKFAWLSHRGLMSGRIYLWQSPKMVLFKSIDVECS